MQMSLTMDVAGLKNGLEYALRQIQNTAERKMQVAVDDAITEFLPWHKKRIEELFHKAVETFYASYSPLVYVRTEGLYDLVDITTQGHGWQVLLRDEQLQPSHAGISNEALYTLVFEEGWHGGAWSGPNHPNSGTPYWRAPAPNYTYWSRSAAKSTPPLQTFTESYEEYIDGEAVSEFQDIVRRKAEESFQT